MKKILKYQLATEVNRGTEEAPDIELLLNAVEIRCTAANYESNLALAQAEAYQGQVAIEDEPETEEEIRTQRDKLLAETDWTQTLDAPIDAASRDAYRVYRQALRDVPEQEGFPANVVWPELPAVVKADPDPVDTAFDMLVGGDGNA